MKQKWSEKYRPSKIEDYIFENEGHKAIINKFIEEKSIPDLCLYGHRGTGKTSLVYLLKSILEIEDSDFLELNASKNNSVEIVRSKITSFAATMASGPFKIIFLDECERLTPEAMDALKKPIEEYSSNVRFIFACNKVGKLIPELRSRCFDIEFKSLDKNDIIERAYTIIKAEKTKISLETLEKYVEATYPDFRKLLNQLQANAINGVISDEIVVPDSLFEVKAECMLHVESGDWDSARKLLAEQFLDEDYESLFTFFYSNLTELDKFKDNNKWKAGIVLIAEYLYRNQFVADKEINFCALLIRLSEI